MKKKRKKDKVHLKFPLNMLYFARGKNMVRNISFNDEINYLLCYNMVSCQD